MIALRRAPLSSLAALALATLALGAASTACMEGDGHRPHPVGGEGALLSAAADCGDLLGLIQADALAKVEILSQQYLEGYGYGWWGRADGDWDTAVPEAPPADAASREYSDTNVQVQGVDEADIVKTDGTRIYVLSGSRLSILKAWPPEETAVEDTLEIEGYGQEMFVAGGRAVIFSNTADPRQGGTPDGCWGYDDVGPWRGCYGTGFTKITVAHLGGDEPVVERELYVEGHYRSSRRHDGQVRAVVQTWGAFYSLQLPDVWAYLYRDGHGARTESEHRRRVRQWHADATAAVLGTSLGDWLPDMIERREGSLQAMAPVCELFYVARPGMATDGITQIVGFDMNDPADATRTAVWGNADHVYANHDALVLAQHDHTVTYFAQVTSSNTYSDRTVLHRFALDAGGATRYEASGLVPGSVLNQFSMDERDGIVRVATTEHTWTAWWDADWDSPAVWTPPPTVNQVLTLQADGTSTNLVVLGSTGPLAPDERIYATRFLGDVAYMVTFREVDPLFAIDLSDPADPVVLGELKIPGFSNYMHPLGDGHLLTIGQEADETGRVLGLALQIFDVTDPTDPIQKHKHVFADAWGYSEASWDHKAFTYFASRGLLAFPYVAWGSDWSSYRSSLEVFEVDAEAGFTPLGGVDHSELVGELCDPLADFYCGSYAYPVRRGIFIEDFVYSVSYGGVRVNHVGDLTADVATALLTP
jgi:hypothetical protein